MHRFLTVLLFVLPVMGAGQAAASGLVANGFAKYTELGDVLYVGALFLGDASNNPSVIRQSTQKRVEIKIIPERLSYRRFGRILIKSSAINNSSRALIKHAEAMENFLGWFKGNLISGDHIVLTRVNNGFTMELNGVQLATIESTALFDMLLNIWIGDVPPDRDFKGRILGAENAKEFQQDFESLTFEPTRVAEIEYWKVDLEALAAAEEAKKAEQLREQLVAREAEQARLASAAERKREAEARAALEAKVAVAPTVPPVVSGDATTIEDGGKPTQVALLGAPKQILNEEKRAQNEFSAENLLAMQLYANKLLMHSQRQMEYPSISRRLGQEGTVVASVTIDRDGKLISFVFTDESKHRAFNRAVKKGIERSEPYPKIPDAIPGEDFSFRVPVNFKFSD